MQATERILIAAGALILVGVPVYTFARTKLGLDIALWRKAMLKRADEHVQAGTLYQWGGGHPVNPDSWGLDCSGLIIDCARAAGFVLEWNSGSMWQLLPRVGQPAPADVALYGYNDKAIHVTLVERWHPEEGRAEIIGSQGGDSGTTTPEIARQQEAFVRKGTDHRKDTRFMGFCSLADIAEGRRSGKTFSGWGQFG
jgi:hypothetical protein